MTNGIVGPFVGVNPNRHNTLTAVFNKQSIAGFGDRSSIEMVRGRIL